MLKNSVKIYRTIKGFTQQDLADLVGCTRQTINSIEKNKYNPSLELGLRIAEVLEEPIHTIFQLEKK